MSEQLWGFGLREHLPRVLSRDGVVAVVGEISRVRMFLDEQFSSLTEEVVNAPPTPAAVAKQWYLRTACDLIELQHAGRTIGVIVGAPEDWGSYYVRIFAVSPAYQRPALIRRFARECVFEPLHAHNVARVVADTSPTNHAMSRLFSELHFHVTGHQLSDRWGPMVRYTKFLDPACEAVFCGRFEGTTPRNQVNDRQPQTRERREHHEEEIRTRLHLMNSGAASDDESEAGAANDNDSDHDSSRADTSRNGAMK